ncbi:unnamed protein product, partial [Mesorhabditis spiculigera]
MAVYDKSSKLIECTSLFQGRCRLRNLHNISETPVVSETPVIANDEPSSAVVFVGGGPVEDRHVLKLYEGHIESKLVRVCKGDPNYNSYTEVSLTCKNKNMDYNLLTDVYLSKAGYDLAKELDIRENDAVLYGVFQLGDPTSSKKEVPTAESALCIYSMRDVEEMFRENIMTCYQGAGNKGLEWLNIRQECVSTKLRWEQLKCGSDVNKLIGGAKAIESKPVLEMGGRFTAVAANTTHSTTIVFIGTDDGRILKTSIQYRNSTFVYEELHVSPNEPILQDMEFSETGKYVYVLTPRKVTRIPTSEVWLLGYELQRLPAFRLFRLINLTSSLLWQLRQKDVRLLLPPPTLHFYDCGKYKSCSECTRSQFPCDWCLESNECVDGKLTEDRCRQQNFINGIARKGQSPPARGPNHCPYIKAPHGKMFVGVGEKRNVSVKVANLDPSVMHKFRCSFRIGQQLHEKQAALVDDDTIVCDEMRFNQPELKMISGTAPVDFQVNWSSPTSDVTHAFDNVNGTAVEFDCGWCEKDAKCVRPRACRWRSPSDWLNSTQLCPHPVIISFDPKKGPAHGNTKIRVTGVNLGRSAADLRGAVLVANVPCTVQTADFISPSEFYCTTKNAPGVGYKGPMILKLQDSPIYSVVTTEQFSYVEPKILGVDPVEGPTSGGTDLVLTGENLDSGSEMKIKIGGSACKVLERNESRVLCRTGAAPMESGMAERLSGDMPITMDVDDKEAHVRQGLNFAYRNNPKIFEVRPEHSIMAGGIVVDVAGDGFKLLQRPHMLLYADGKAQPRMDNIEMKVATECKEAFAELQTSLNAYSAELPLGSSMVPFLEYKEYAARVLFPNLHKHPVLRELEVDSTRAAAVENSLREFHKLILNKTFLTTWVRVMESNKYFLGKDRVYVGSLLMVVLQEKMPYCTEILKHLLKELIERTVEKKVLDCDTVTQVKEKCLEAKFRAIPYSERPKADDLDLEWRTGLNGRLLLQDVDSTSRVEPSGWKKMNTLLHYQVPNNAVMGLMARQNSLYNLSLLSERSEKSTMSIKNSPTLSRPFGTSSSSYSREHDTHNKLYHLVKTPEHGPNDSNEKMVSEIYLTRLLMMKGTLQKFINDLLEAIFSTGGNAGGLPYCIKYMFDFMDDQAQENGITDPEVVHAWKSNALPLRFWVNLIKNPHFLFDIPKPTKVEGCLSVVAQTLMDACSTQDHQLTKDSPSSKLLFAKDIYQYRDLVDTYYTDIQRMGPIPDAEMQDILAEESRQHKGQFHVFSALNELYKYLDQYRDGLIEALEHSEAAQAARLPARLQDMLAMMESQHVPDYDGSTLGHQYNSASRLMGRH